LKTKKNDTAIAINIQELICVSRCKLLVRQQLETLERDPLREEQALGGFLGEPS
jgi:hypothetical protein